MGKKYFKVFVLIIFLALITIGVLVNRQNTSAPAAEITEDIEEAEVYQGDVIESEGEATDSAGNDELDMGSPEKDAFFESLEELE